MLSYLFNLNPGSNFKFYTPMIMIAGILIVGGLFFGFYFKKHRKANKAFAKLFRHLSGRLILIGLLFALLTLMRFESIPYLSMRIWLLLSFLLLGFVIIYYLRQYKVKYPALLSHYNKPNITKQTERTYLPNKKHRKHQ